MIISQRLDYETLYLKNINLGVGSGMLDRSPCGSGTAAIVASKWAKGEFKIGQLYFGLYIFASDNH